MGSGKEKEEHVKGAVTEEAVFKTVKKIVVKFIEVGRLTPANFEETYDKVYEVVKRSVQSS